MHECSKKNIASVQKGYKLNILVPLPLWLLTSNDEDLKDKPYFWPWHKDHKKSMFLLNLWWLKYLFSREPAMRKFFHWSVFCTGEGSWDWGSLRERVIASLKEYGVCPLSDTVAFIVQLLGLGVKYLNRISCIWTFGRQKRKMDLQK